MNLELYFSRIILVWMFATTSALFYVIQDDNAKFNIGPNPNFFILNVCIDTPAKYITIVSFCFINSAFRTSNHTILQSWITNTVQNKQCALTLVPSHSYEISFISTIYNWFDFFMYMNILMAQFDMLLVEIVSDLLITFFVTRYYLSENKKNRIKIFDQEPLLNC